MTERHHFADWRSVRDALEHAYAKLGLEMIQTAPGCREYPAEHWNIAGFVHEQASAEYSRLVGSCINCKGGLNFETVIRCLDCRATLCERCAVQHFGPSHPKRAAAAHGDG